MSGDSNNGNDNYDHVRTNLNGVCFVVDLGDDHAPAAIKAYAQACGHSNPALARTLMAKASELSSKRRRV